MNNVETERILQQGIQQRETIGLIVTVTFGIVDTVVIGALAKVGWNAIQERRRAAFVRQTLMTAQETNQGLSKGQLFELILQVPISQYDEKTANLIGAALSRLQPE